MVKYFNIYVTLSSDREMVRKRLCVVFRSAGTTSGRATGAMHAGRHGADFDNALVDVGGANSNASARPDLLFCLKLKAM